MNDAQEADLFGTNQKIMGLSYITLGGGGVVDTGHDLEEVYVSGPSVKSCRSVGLPECVRGDWKSLVQSLVQSATWNAYPRVVPITDRSGSRRSHWKIWIGVISVSHKQKSYLDYTLGCEPTH